MFDFIVGVISHECVIEGNKCHYQMAFSFGKGQTVVSA